MRHMQTTRRAVPRANVVVLHMLCCGLVVQMETKRLGCSLVLTAKSIGQKDHLTKILRN